MLDRKLLRDLWRVRGQAITIALVVACGIGGFIASLSTHDSITRARDQYYDAAGFPHLFVELKRAPEAVAPRIGTIAGVARHQTRVVQDVQLDLAGVAQPVTGRLIGLGADHAGGLSRLTLRRGRWIVPERPGEVLVSERFAEARGLAPGAVLHALLNGRRERLVVAGIVLSPEFVYASRGGALPDDEWFGVLWMDHRHLATAFDMQGAFNSAVVQLAPGASPPAVIRMLDRLLAPWGGRGSYGREDQISHKIVSQEIQQQRVLGTLLPGIMLVVAVFILNVVLHRLVATQREQIAALKALGYADRTIAGHYLRFTTVIVAAGIAIGLGLGQWLGHYMTAMYTSFFHFPAFQHQTLPWVVLAAAGASLAGAFAGALQAIRQVVTLAPAEAMRPPAPAIYRATLPERMGLARLISPGARMVLRNLERRPLRATFASLGVAGSVAILIAGTFWTDAIDHFIDVQFNHAQAGAVYLGLVEPAGREALYEIARLPGVLRVEGVRSLAVRVTHGHRLRRAALTGIDPGGGMQRAIDFARGEQAVPAEGMLVNRRLADALGVVPGDVVGVEVLEGRRRQGELRVSGVFDELAGVNAYMDLAALARFAGEGEIVTSAALAVDAGGRAALMARLKEVPRVASVIVKDSLLATFRETSARNMLFFTGVLTVFAATIAVGVVYNSARIALSERAWELASLRVLGFTRGEVSAIFLGELSVVIALGIPLGFAGGWALAFTLVTLTHSDAYQIPLVILPSTYAYAALVVLAAGAASAMIVRHRIDHLDLVAVLKTRE